MEDEFAIGSRWCVITDDENYGKLLTIISKKESYIQARYFNSISICNMWPAWSNFYACFEYVNDIPTCDYCNKFCKQKCGK